MKSAVKKRDFLSVDFANDFKKRSNRITGFNKISEIVFFEKTPRLYIVIIKPRRLLRG
ncbi:unknown [[Mannheimia] succiniciproducens MBEL55E]|uniref:Uncharacterized protein n=1 Tax=Mannheimia succiniciproducens (strain KCTC 0769BP / MBEL55E) TaxID=221988 RepID=Q65V83_MANSM|nr:unknown [[Mannheimia] succiniciproducens MBEL55E]